MKYDIIIIGAGLGGLTAGAKLAKEGRRVLLIEQHDKPGGCATTFRRKDFVFEVGLHEMDGLDKRDIQTRIFSDLGVFDHVEFLRVPEFYHFIHNRHQITIPHDPAVALDRLVSSFTAEESGIRAFFDRLLNARKRAKESEEEPEQTIGEFLDSIIVDEELKLVLMGNLGYFHDDPYSMSLNYYAIAQGSYFQGGGNFIKGGSQKLSDCLSDVIIRYGGVVLLNHMVTGIIVENNRAVGVKYTGSRKGSSPEIRAFAEEIIANSAIPNVADHLLSGEHGEHLRQQLQGLNPGASLLTLYLGFRKKLKDLGSRYYSTFVFDDSIKTIADIHSNNRGDFERRSFTFIDYSQVDAGLTAGDKSVAVICCKDYCSDWEGLTPEAYKAMKERVANIFIRRLEELVPGAASQLEYFEVGTARTVQRYTLNPAGAVYGFAQTPFRVRKENIKGIDHLHFASAWTKTGGGFSGAIYSGYFCALGIIRKATG